VEALTRWFDLPFRNLVGRRLLTARRDRQGDRAWDLTPQHLPGPWAPGDAVCAGDTVFELHYENPAGSQCKPEVTIGIYDFLGRHDFSGERPVGEDRH
jgi:hypothetical protein